MMSSAQTGVRRCLLVSIPSKQAQTELRWCSNHFVWWCLFMQVYKKRHKCSEKRRMIPSYTLISVLLKGQSRSVSGVIYCIIGTIWLWGLSHSVSAFIKNTDICCHLSKQSILDLSSSISGAILVSSSISDVCVHRAETQD